MERYTKKEQGNITVPPDQLEQALERLAAFEDLACGLEEEQQQIAQRLGTLREQGKEKTVQFRELLGQKLVNNNMILLLERYRIR